MPDYRHFTLQNSRSSHRYVSANAGGARRETPPRPERRSHAEKLLADLDRAEARARARLASDPAREGLQFVPLRFDKSAAFDLELARLANERRGVRVVSVREEGARKRYVVAVPDTQVARLAQAFRAYRDEDAPSGRPKNEPLASSIAAIDAAELADYWTAADEPLPPPDDAFWWEVWLDDRPTDWVANVEAWFRTTAAQQGVLVSSERMRFPERVVVLAYTSLARWERFPGLLRHLAEFRRANLIAGDFVRLPPSAQAEFVHDLLQRTRYAAESATAICLLDTGVERGHPLLELALSPAEFQAWRAEWGADDHHGHGTEMAGLCLFGPLTEPLMSREAVELRHRLESVKILPRAGVNEPPDYGPITTGSMALAEVAAPGRRRVFCLAVTAESDDHWRPTLWSAALDQAAAGASEGARRLVIVSVGNLRQDVGTNYPVENYVSSVEDPSQAWNALAVGAYTSLTWAADRGLDGDAPIARPGSLSPASRTSLCWESNWPYKPDVVFEGGNYAVDVEGNMTSAEDLEILTTRSAAGGTALLGTIRDTSAAAAQVARMAATLQTEYEDYWPETIRGLIVHSAKWTPAMLEEFPYRERRNRLRVYGMGVPDVERARRSARGYATMVVQDELQPFQPTGSTAETNEMRLHDLPLPREVLEELGSLPVRMRVTLSYFIEPNPPRRGYVAQYQYASHGLRFSVRRPQETRETMLQRLSREFWSVGEDRRRVRTSSVVSDDREWDLGPEKVAVRGSIHSDAWNGTAAQLASSNLVAVYPVSGWWRYRDDASVVARRARYSLIVSISTEDSEVDLFGAIASEIALRSRTPIATEVRSE